MIDQRITPPPAALLGFGTLAPEARTLIAEVRSDASVPFDPKAAPAFLTLPGVAFGALIQWRVDASWVQAQQIQLWLTGAPAGGLFPTRQEALKDFFENLQVGGVQFLEYVGTYLTAGLSHASYTLVLGMRSPVPRDQYQAEFQNALNGLLAVGGPVGWPAELISFLKMFLNQPSTREEFLTLASSVGDLLQNGPPLIQMLVR
ncbi:MAG: hypothetical protein ABW003_26555 [Microvirga sp.]